MTRKIKMIVPRIPMLRELHVDELLLTAYPFGLAAAFLRVRMIATAMCKRMKK